MVRHNRNRAATSNAMKTYTAEDFKAWGAQGGAKSKRVLTAAQAKAMVAAREKKRRKTKRVTRRANGEIRRPGTDAPETNPRRQPGSPASNS